MPRIYLVALLVLLLSGTFELDACSGAFVHSAGRLLQRVHRPTRALDSSCPLAARGPAPQRARAAWGPAMQAGPGVGRKRPTGLGHEIRATMSDEQLGAMRTSMLRQSSERRVQDLMEQKRNEFMAQQRAKSAAKAAAAQRAAAQASEQARKNEAAAVLAEAVRSQPMDVAEGASPRGAAQQQNAAGAAEGGGWALLEQALAGGQALSDKQLSGSRPAKTAAPKTSAKKQPALGLARAKPAAAAPAPPRFHDLRVQDEPGAAVSVVDPSDVWTHDRPMPRMKRPEELREIIRICALPLRGVGDHEDAPYHPEEVAIQQVRLTGRRWFQFLEAEDLIDIGKDPARFPAPVREQFLKEVEMEGRDLTPQDEAITAMRTYMDSRERRDIMRSIKYVEKLANDYALFFGAPALEAMIENVKYSAEQEEAAKGDPLILQAVSAGHILQGYMRASAEATEFLGQGHVLSADWDRGKCLFHEFENMRAAALGQLRAHLRQQTASKASGQPLQASEVLLEEGQFVDVEIKSKGPLGYLVKVDHKYDGLVYHNDIFQDPPSVGDVTDGWVLKVREDGKVDVSLRPPGAVAKISAGVERLLQALEANGKRLPVGDKSSPKEIYNAVGLSKKVFKEALGHMYKRKMVVLDRTHVYLQPMERWETGIIGSKEEPKPSKAKAAASARGSGAEGKPKKARASRKKSLYQGEYRALPKVPLPGAVEEDALQAEQNSFDLQEQAQPRRTEASTQLAKREVEKRRAGVEATLREDEAHFKAQAQERLSKAKAAQLAKMQVEHQKRVASLKHEVVDVAEQERRKALLKSTRAVAGNGLKATMERMKALKADKARASPPPATTATTATAEAQTSAAAPPTPSKAPAPPRAQPVGVARILGNGAPVTASEEAQGGVRGGWGGRASSSSSLGDSKTAAPSDSESTARTSELIG